MTVALYVRTKKIKRFYTDAIAEYTKRLSRYCKFSMKINEKPKDAMDIHGILICKDGQAVSSEALSAKMQALSLASVSDIRIAIGWAEGTEGIKAASSGSAFEHWDKLCISDMELTPELEAVIMTEQLYRAYRIWHHEPYHF